MRTWIDSPGDMVMENPTTGDKVILYFQPCGWFGYDISGVTVVIITNCFVDYSELWVRSSWTLQESTPDGCV